MQHWNPVLSGSRVQVPFSTLVFSNQVFDNDGHVEPLSTLNVASAAKELNF